MTKSQQADSGSEPGANPSENEGAHGSGNIKNLAYTNSVQVVNLVLHDVATFMRNNHSIYTAACASALSQTGSGENNGDKLLQQAEQVLRLNTSYFDEVSEKCVTLLKNLQALES